MFSLRRFTSYIIKAFTSVLYQSLMFYLLHLLYMCFKTVCGENFFPVTGLHNKKNNYATVSFIKHLAYAFGACFTHMIVHVCET